MPNGGSKHRLPYPLEKLTSRTLESCHSSRFQGLARFMALRMSRRLTSFDLIFFFGPISLSPNVGNALRRGLCGASRPNCTEGPPLLLWIVGARSGNLPKQPHQY